ncbi:MAG TPA: response regulator transcription factor [Baekduia sp.]|nr:response regulator transcription factor [Baekduia sp.]
MPGSVLIVDDHPRFRATARRALECDGWTVVGEAADGRDGLAEAQRLAPDLVLLDIGLPDVSGLVVARQLADRAPEIAVVLVSTRDAGDFAELAAAHGAKGFLPKADVSGLALDGLLTR